MEESIFEYEFCDDGYILEIEYYNGEIVAKWKMDVDVWLQVIIDDFLDDLSKGN
jgi:hypothetical protein